MLFRILITVQLKYVLLLTVCVSVCVRACVRACPWIMTLGQNCIKYRYNLTKHYFNEYTSKNVLNLLFEYKKYQYFGKITIH